MADVYMHHSPVEQAINEMVVTTRKMSNALDDLIAGLTPMASTFSGEAATAWVEFQTVANTADQKMQELFGTGSTVLAEMQRIIKDGDRRGANHLFG